MKVSVKKLRIWFDLSNSPHINLFASMIRELQQEHEIIITCRPLANTIDLLKLHGFSFEVVGRHYGANTLKKVIGYPLRVFQLCQFLRKHKPDVAISQSSFHSPLVSRILGIPSIYMNDNEHAVGNIPSFIFADTIMIPEYLDRKRVYRQGARDCKIIQYPGVKEGIYLWKLSDLKGKEHPSTLQSGIRTVYVRPEPLTAQYYNGKLNFMDSLLMGLQNKAKVILLPRSDAQAMHYKKPEFSGILIAEKPLGLADIAKDCRLFIGAGGTMTREMAVLGIPTISVYQADLLDVDKHLIKIGQMIHKPNLDAEYTLNFLNSCEPLLPNTELLSKGKQSYNLIKSVLLRDKLSLKEKANHD